MKQKTLAELLASLSTIPASEAMRIGKLHAYLKDGTRVFFVWNGERYEVKADS